MMINIETKQLTHGTHPSFHEWKPGKYVHPNLNSYPVKIQKHFSFIILGEE